MQKVCFSDREKFSEPYHLHPKIGKTQHNAFLWVALENSAQRSLWVALENSAQRSLWVALENSAQRSLWVALENSAQRSLWVALWGGN
ncbi:PF11689 domain protein [Leptospira interrogans serovar Pyrogenes str. 2006006960]|nr:PF11689 domain protein [Leptospira interrogans serovar Pyrogenes str. 2006006960]